ncbi:MAG: hypothetical protein E7231_00975 [Cellulosilyticum sp.]|nr:hypothetical protein [Cellulosilyticum sp.]
MQKKVVVLVGVILLGIQLCSLYFIGTIYQMMKLSNGDTKSIKQQCQINEVSLAMNLQQAADYLGIESEQLRRVLVTERNILDERGSFSGDMIPYIKIDDEYCFSKIALDEWLYATSRETVNYDTNTYERSK